MSIEYRRVSMRAWTQKAGSLPSLLDVKTLSCPDSPPHRGRQIVLSRHVRVQQENRLKEAQP